MGRIALATVVVLGLLVLPSGASAASPADCPTGAPARAPHPELVGGLRGYAAGDDPVVVEPATPTCDDGGYDLEFPDAALESDAVPAGALNVPGYELPRTDFDGYSLMLTLMGAVMLFGGVLLHVHASLRELEHTNA